MCKKMLYPEMFNQHHDKFRAAILSIEAALVIPIFLMTMTMLLSTVLIFYASQKIDAAINEEAGYVSVKAYDNSGYSESGITANVNARLGNSFLKSGLIKGGTIDFSDSDTTNPELIIVSAKYSIDLPYDLFSLCDFSYESRVVLHTWIGYINGLAGYNSYGEYVYRTVNGSVYHRNRECSHLKLDITSVSAKDIAVLRNSSGCKYKKCIYCHSKLSDEKLYITSDGTRYHNSLSCSGLKRTIIRIRLNEARDLRPCSRCGY